MLLCTSAISMLSLGCFTALNSSSIYLDLSLIHFNLMFHFYTPRKRQKTLGFLAFSGGIEMEHWATMG